MIFEIEDYYENTITRVEVQGNFNVADEDIDTQTGERVLRLQREEKY